MNQNLMENCQGILQNIQPMMKIFERYQAQVKANIYEIECNTRAVINTLEQKIQNEKISSCEDPSQHPKFFEETQKSLKDAQ